MQVVKLSFILAAFLLFCSFENLSNQNKARFSALYKANLYEQFLSKFEHAPSRDAVILDVRIHQPLPVSEDEFQASNTDRAAMKKIVQERMLLGDFDIFISEISKKQRHGTRPNTYEAEYLVKQTNNMDILIYSEYQDARQYAKTYYMAVFSKLGVVLAKERIGMSNRLVYTEAKISNQLILDAISVLDGQKLALSKKKIKIQKKGNVDVLSESHPYLDESLKNTRLFGVRNYRLP